MKCHGNGDSHCCWFNGEVCRFLEEYTVPGRRWACGLVRQYGGWDAALASPEVVGSATPTLGAVTLTADASVPGNADAAITLGALTLSATASQ